jgi:hypothetical protein
MLMAAIVGEPRAQAHMTCFMGALTCYLIIDDQENGQDIEKSTAKIKTPR